MALSNPIVFEGIQSVDFIDKTTNLPLGRLRVLQSAELSHEINKTQLTGGAAKSPWASADGAATTTLTVVTNEYPNWLVELASGGVATDRAAETSGNVSSITDLVGTSITDGTNGVTVSASTASELKSGKYYIKATGAQTGELYLVGANVSGTAFTNDALLIDTLDLSGSDVITGYGLTIAPIGTASLTVDDIAYFTVRAINVDSYNVAVGAETDALKNVEIIVAGKSSSGKQVIGTFYNCKGGSLPLNLAPDTFTELSLEFDVLYCANEGKAFDIDYIDAGASTVC